MKFIRRALLIYMLQGIQFKITFKKKNYANVSQIYYFYRTSFSSEYFNIRTQARHYFLIIITLRNQSISFVADTYQDLLHNTWFFKYFTYYVQNDKQLTKHMNDNILSLNYKG